MGLIQTDKHLAYMLSDENLDVIEDLHDKVKQKWEVIDIGKDNMLNREKFKFEQSRYSSPEKDRSKRFYFIRDMKYANGRVLSYLLPESRPLNLVFVVNIIRLPSMSRAMQDLFFGLTNQKLVDLSLDRKILEAPRVREYLSYSRVPLDDHNGFYYNGERRDGMLEKVVGKSELL